MEVRPVLFCLKYYHLTSKKKFGIKIELYKFDIVLNYLTNECFKMIQRFITKIRMIVQLDS